MQFKVQKQTQTEPERRKQQCCKNLAVASLGALSDTIEPPELPKEVVLKAVAPLLTLLMLVSLSLEMIDISAHEEQSKQICIVGSIGVRKLAYAVSLCP